MNPATKIVQNLFERLGVSNEPHTRSSNGFTWRCGGGPAQTVTVGPAETRDDEAITPVRIETTLFTVRLNEKSIHALAYVNRFASLSALVWDEASSALSLRASVYVSERNVPGCERLVAAACVTQLLPGVDARREACRVVRRDDDAQRDNRR